MNVLVTGGAGFIGSHITEGLLSAGHDVTVLDVMDPFYDLKIKEQNLERCRDAGGDRFSFIEGSITDEDVIERVIADNDIEYVYNQAAQAGVRASVENPKKVHKINTTGVLNLLETANAYDVERVIHASSSSVYGVDKYLPYDESHPNTPQSPYGVSKLTAEHYCRVWSEIHDVPTVCLRYFTVYGPRMRPNMAITNFTSRCLNGESPVIYGDGEQTRDFTYVDDVVAANLKLLETDAADGTVMNVGSAGTITIDELAAHVVEATGADVEIAYDAAREADARHTHADVSRAHELIGYKPTTSIRDGVSQFVAWYRENRDWYEPLVRRS
ncbi:NAD-dependent epimerase/dehydratase family protein [Natronolimnobius sp. AArcel1]|uniref:GDP-mannose 4,6-dehydratase n=1 Tax=Natronolimnobius sp. AArcel1 TaxID=1679093 RepID=UPI0013EBE1BB|nr:GDP-mannose 4,6-dehydratase [Natronolimnobius sp. AArcel1]NGM67796.1 NAD-dependent epimerase/dehydratase family protein [Natronolimnobius sp. AArcel1]